MDDVNKLVSRQGFINAFWQEMKNHKTQVAAYEALEQVYERHYGQRRYSDYNSFRNVRDRVLRNV